MKWPKILVVTPIYEAKDYSLDKFLKNAEKIDYPNYDHVLIDNSANTNYWRSIKGKCAKRGIKVYHVRRGKTSREALTRAQNKGRDLFLEGDYDYFLSLESDIFPPKNALKKLVMWGERVVSAAYLIGHGDKKLPCATVFHFKEDLGVMGTRLIGVKDHPDKPGKKYIDNDELNEFCEPGLRHVAAAGMGCCLIARSVLEKIRFMYEPGLQGHSDIYFFNDCVRNKIPAFVDTHIWCYHDNSDWNDVEDR